MQGHCSESCHHLRSEPLGPPIDPHHEVPRLTSLLSNLLKQEAGNCTPSGAAMPRLSLKPPADSQ